MPVVRQQGEGWWYSELVPEQVLPGCGETVAARAKALMTAEVLA